MAFSKVTLLFELNTIATGTPAEGRTAGWSESFYFGGEAEPAIEAAIVKNGLCARRGATLPSTASIVGIRAQKVDPLPLGPSIARRLFFQGTSGALTDVPQLTLLWELLSAGIPNKRMYHMRGLPDSNAEGGEYVSANDMDAKLNLLRTAMSNFNFRSFDRTQPVRDILTFTTATRTVVTSVDHGFAIGDNVQLKQLKSQLVPITFGGTFKVETVPLANSFTIRSPSSWPDLVQGKAQKKVVIFPPISQTLSSWVRTTVRKVGRPFDLFRGRK